MTLNLDYDSSEVQYISFITSESKNIIYKYYNLDILSNGNGIINEISGDYLSGTTVNLTATPEDDYEFISWNIDGDIYNTPIIDILINSNKVAVATFQLIAIRINWNVNPSIYIQSKIVRDFDTNESLINLGDNQNEIYSAVTNFNYQVQLYNDSTKIITGFEIVKGCINISNIANGNTLITLQKNIGSKIPIEVNIILT